MEPSPETQGLPAVRAMSLEDVEGALQLFDAVAEERLWIGTEPGYDRERYREMLARSLSRGHGMFVAQASDGTVVGLLSSREYEEYGWTLGMLVDARYRGRGLGRQLMDALFGWAREHGVPRLSLLVFPHNERALRLYTSMGFVEVERYPNDVTRADGAVWDTILMRKVL